MNVDRWLRFKADAAHQQNIKGNPDPERMFRYDFFDGKAIDSTNWYTITVGGTNDAIAVAGGGIGGCKFTTGTGDNEICFLATPLIFDITQSPEICARIHIADVTGSSMFFGFSDAVTETTPASTIDYADGTLAAAATDACGFVVDADKSSSAVYTASIKTGGSVAATAASPATVWTDNQIKDLRIKLDTSGNATFWIDDSPVGYRAACVTDVPLCAIINMGTRANDGAQTNYAYFLKYWQDVTARA